MERNDDAVDVLTITSKPHELREHI